MGDAGKPVLQKPPGYKDPSVPATVRPPPRKPQLPPAFLYPGKPPRRYRNRSCCCRLCCCLFIIFIVIIVLFTISGGFAYLWFHPQLPSFHVENVTVPVFNITMQSDGTFLDASATVKIQAANPNSKLGLSYRLGEGKIALVDEDGEVDLGTGSMAGFNLRRKNSTSVRLTVVAKEMMLDDSVGARLKARYKSKDIRLNVEMRTNVGFVINSKATAKFPIRVKCLDVSLKQSGSARPLPKCDIDVLSGIF